MSDGKNPGEAEPRPPSAASLNDAVVAALAQREAQSTEPTDDAPVISAVAIGGAIAVGGPVATPKPEDPDVTVGSDASDDEADAASEQPAAPSALAPSSAVDTSPGTGPAPAAAQAAPAEAASAPAAPTSEKAAPTSTPSVPDSAPRALDAAPRVGEGAESSQDELTAPRGLSITRELPEGIAIRYFGRTDVGLVREHNEDNFLVVDVNAARRGTDEKPIDTILGNKGCVLAVCDGMGGAAAGEVASQMAVDTIHEMMSGGSPPKDRDHFARRLVRAVEEAGSRIFSAAKLDRSRRGMGTTSTVAGLVDSMLFVGQVGDSRAYVLRGDQFALITKDQSLVNQLIEAGQLTEEEAEAFEHSNIILQALGTTEEVAVDLTFLELRRGDRLLICSDGLSGLVHADMMKDVLRASRDLVEAANQLIALANAGGGHDNITVIVAEFDGTGLKDSSPDAKVAYQQYPLPPATADSAEPPPPRPVQMKAATAKPGADVKHAGARASEPPAGGLGRWWVVALLVLLVLALVGAILLSVDGSPEAAIDPPSRATLTRTVTPEPARETSGHLRFDGRYAGAHLEIDGETQGTLSSGSMIVDVTPGSHSVRVLREGAVVASAQTSVEAGHHEFVQLEAVAPLGVEPPAGMAALPPSEPVEEPSTETGAGPAGEAAPSERPIERRIDRPTTPPPTGEAPERPYRRQAGDLPHEPPSTATTP